jgi:hypothetical protein
VWALWALHACVMLCAPVYRRWRCLALLSVVQQQGPHGVGAQTRRCFLHAWCSHAAGLAAPACLQPVTGAKIQEARLGLRSMAVALSAQGYGLPASF